MADLVAILRSVSTGACTGGGAGTAGDAGGWNDTDIGVLLPDLAALRASFSTHSASSSLHSSALNLVDCLDSACRDLLDAVSAIASSSGSVLFLGRPRPLFGAIL